VRVGNGTKFTFLSEVIACNLGSLFHGMTVEHAHMFRVTRDADIDIREDEASDLLRALQHELRKRRFGSPVRLEVAAGMPEDMLVYLMESIGVEPDDVYVIDGPLNIIELGALADLDLPEALIDLRAPVVREAVAGVLRIAITVRAAFIDPISDIHRLLEIERRIERHSSRIALLGPELQRIVVGVRP